jgi:hypothetical protein
MRSLLLSSLFLLTTVVGGCASAGGYAAGDTGYAAEAPASYDEAETIASDGMMPQGIAVAERGASLFGGVDAPAPAAPPPPPPKAQPLPTTSSTPATPGEAKPIEANKRLVIYTGSMAVMVPVTEVAVAAFIAHVDGLGGYLQNRAATSITVRVPADRFFAVLDWVRKNGQVTDESVNANDVTKRVFDLELRLQVAEESRKRMLKLLETATRMEDILTIERELRRLTDEIEGMKGELRHLGDQIAFSTLTVSFYADAPSPTPYPKRTRSRFPWVNQVGIERVLSNF